MSDLVAEVRDLRMRYGTREVLNGVGFSVRTGEVLALLGPNGAGKTTTIEILEGFRMRSAGYVSVLGEDPAHAGEQWRARLGVVLQSWRDHSKWRVRELLKHLGTYYARYATPEIRRPWDTDELLDLVGLTAQGSKRIGYLSGGQRRRLDVAIGIVGRPELLFLDEPTTGFDPAARREFHELIHRLTDREPAASILVLFLQRGGHVPGTTFSLGSLTLPSVIGLNFAMGGMLGVTGLLVVDREDGTLLRAKATPGGMTGYVIGKITLISATTLIGLVATLIIGFTEFHGLTVTAAGWLTLIWVAVLGLLATVPLGIIVGSVIPNPRALPLFILPFGGLTAVSGIFYPITHLPGWLQYVGQVFPMYWLGLGMRAALLPRSLAAVEIGGSWRLGYVLLALGGWAVAGLLVAPPVLRRMARHESGSKVAARRERAMLQRP